ncbi:hypothetical protein H0H92_006300 [Tricholoma furcatifolium]|nr:hypothetical protein H0H92_006300 [Tricholoma furcatifolium]
MGKSRLVAFLIAGSVMLIVGGLEVGVVFAVRPSMNPRAIDFFGIFSSIMIAGGLLPQYYEIFKRGEVIGISIPFIAIDCLGGVFSIVSLAFRPEFDIKAGIAYSLVTALDAGIIIASVILHPSVRKHLKSKKEKYSREMTQNSTTPIWRPTPSIERQSPEVNVGNHV